jgi:hypothetical protein
MAATRTLRKHFAPIESEAGTKVGEAVYFVDLKGTKNWR